MPALEAIEENLRFLVAAVENQVKAIRAFMAAPSVPLYEEIISKDDYIDNLKTIIENNCFSRIHAQNPGKQSINRIRAIQTISVNLERIADFSVNILRQTGYLEDPKALESYEYDTAFQIIHEGLDRILPVFSKKDLAGALAICKTEFVLDEIYKQNFDRIINVLQGGADAQQSITLLFIFRYLERIGDSLLNVGEALIFNIIGEKIKIEQFEALQGTLSKSGVSVPIGEIDFQSIWGTRSGCRIGKIGRNKDATHHGAQGGIFKEGVRKKIVREKESLERWHSIFPGLTAQVFGYNEDGANAGLLIEFLSGCTLDECVFSGGFKVVQNAVALLEDTISEVWESTQVQEVVQTDYIKQIETRLSAILSLHPRFFRNKGKIGESLIQSTGSLLEQCRNVESSIHAPFSVLIHGDFNVNNVLYDQQSQRIHFIDVHRSRDFDYVQDISIFLVSNFRIPIFDSHLRDIINWVIGEFYQFAAGFAEKHNDETFSIRMALALARSFYTSTRFETNPQFAREMFLRAHMLMEKITQYKGESWAAFRLPDKALYY